MRFLPLILMMIPGLAFAQLSQNLFIDTKAMSLGNAVTADPVGIMNIHFNPAGLTKLEGRQMELQVMNIMLNAEATFALPDEYQNGDYCNKDLLDVCQDPTINHGTRNNPKYVTAKSKSSGAAFLPGVGIMPSDLPVSPLPKGGVSINPIGSKFTFANAAYMPMAAGFAKEDDDPGRYQAKQVALQRFTYLSPSFGYKVSDTFSVGVSFLFSHQAVAVKQDIRAPSVLIGVLGELQGAFGCFDDDGNPTGNDPLAPIITLCGGKVGPYEDVGELTMITEESLSPSFNLGLLWEPTDWFAWGAGYQGGAKARLKGTYDVKYTDDFAGFFAHFRGSIIGAISAPMFGLPTGVLREKGNVSVNLNYPQHFRTGIKLRAFDRYQLNIDAGWTDFAKWDALEFQFDRSVDFLGAAKTLAPGLVTDTSLKQEMNYKSVWSFAYGFAYDLNSRTQLRMGLEPRTTSVPDDSRSIQSPLGEATLYSIGLGYQWDLDTHLDLSLSFLQSKEDIWADPVAESNRGENNYSSNSINRNCLTCSVSNPYPGLDVHTKLTIGVLGFTYRTRF